MCSERVVVVNAPTPAATQTAGSFNLLNWTLVPTLSASGSDPAFTYARGIRMVKKVRRGAILPDEARTLARDRDLLSASSVAMMLVWHVPDA